MYNLNIFKKKCIIVIVFNYTHAYARDYRLVSIEAILLFFL